MVFTTDFTPFLTAKKQDPFSSAVLLGCPYEDPLAFRKGAAAAPGAIREFSRHLTTYHFPSQKDLSAMSLSDMGDIDFCGCPEEEVFSLLEKTASSFFYDKRFLLALGGSRGISYPLIKAAKKAYPKLKVISLDAHSGREPKGDRVSHDDLFSHLLEDTLREKDLYSFGVRVGSKESFDASGIRNISSPLKVKKGVMEHLHHLCKYPVYLTIDMDVLDPPFAPGSGHPVYGGIGTSELLETVSLLRGLRIVGMDITEIVPCFDHSGITTILGTALVKEALICYGKKER